MFYACSTNQNTIPVELSEGEIFFQTIKQTPFQKDTTFILLVIKGNKVKTLYINQRPHFATLRTCHKDTVQDIYLQNNVRKTALRVDTLNRKKIVFSALTKKDTLFWDIPAVIYFYTEKDKKFKFITWKDIRISAWIVQDLPMLSEYILDQFPVCIVVDSANEKTFTQIIRIEQKDIAEIEFEYKF